jgi:hypothetical protein
MGYWKHNKKYHQSIINNDNLVLPENNLVLPENNLILPENNLILPENNLLLSTNNLNCIYCNKILSRKDHLKNHKKICKIKKENDKKQNELIELENKNKLENDKKQNKLIELENKNKLENDKLKNEIEQLKHLLHKTLKVKPNLLNKINNSKIINSNNTINNNNNTINIVKFGTEDLQNIFTEKQMFNLINKGGLCINESIKYIHFNDKKPEYKNIFITNLKDKYAYVFDGDTFIIKEKNEVLDELLDNHAYNIKEFVEKNRDDLADHTKRSMDRFFCNKCCKKTSEG